MPLTLSQVRILVSALLISPAANAQSSPSVARYLGLCDASAAVPVGPAQFVVANDEDNVLRVYKRDLPGEPVYSCDITAFLDIDPEHPEADIEGATAMGQRLYWITSHGANKKGKPRPNRRRLFATDLSVSGDRVYLTPVGKPYRNLVEDLARLPELKSNPIGAAAAKAPEEQGGLNIEGLSRTPEGALLIGLRNPLPERKAVIVPLENPGAVIAGQPARLGKPIFLNLGGLGIRSIEYSGATGKYLIVAGPYADEGEFQLYEWSGRVGDDAIPVRDADFQGLRPEALIVYPEEVTKIQLLSDDGTEPVNGKDCKDLAVRAKEKGFRSRWVTP